MTANRKISFFLKKTPLLSECGGIMVGYCDIYKCWSQDFSIWRWRTLGSKKKKLIKTNTISLVIYRHHSPRQRLRRCRGRGALRAPAARVGGKVGGGFPVNDCMYVI